MKKAPGRDHALLVVADLYMDRILGILNQKNPDKPANSVKINVVSYKDILLRLSFLTPEIKLPEQKRCKKLSLGASS
jgi:hypothetical protein